MTWLLLLLPNLGDAYLPHAVSPFLIQDTLFISGNTKWWLFLFVAALIGIPLLLLKLKNRTKQKS
jgi:hypothetical protein